jgi:hypothetical protein
VALVDSLRLYGFCNPSLLFTVIHLAVRNSAKGQPRPKLADGARRMDRHLHYQKGPTIGTSISDSRTYLGIALLKLGAYALDTYKAEFWTLASIAR